jgi:hypothetical protein
MYECHFDEASKVFGCFFKTSEDAASFFQPSDQALNYASVEYYHRYFVKSATSKGIIPFLWDTPGGVFDRNTGAIHDRGIVDSIMKGVNVTADIIK